MVNSAQAAIGLSLIVPTYGGRESIGRVVKSLLGQGDAIPVIVVLDGPNPRTRAILGRHWVMRSGCMPLRIKILG